MKAARIHAYGDASVIRLDDVPQPVPAPGEVLVRVAATSFNPSEVGLRGGLLRSIFALDLPYTLGWDLSGIAGGPVIGWVDHGAAAEFVAADPARLVAAPATVPLTHAAALPVAGLTAWQAIFDHAEVEPGQRVLVNGAGGGIGGFAVQLARHAGAHVTATASPRSAPALRRLGADALIDYTRSALRDALDKPVDAILNLIPLDQEQTAALVPLVRPGGRIVSVTTPVDTPPGSGISTAHFVVRNDVDDLAALVRLVDEGVVHLDIAGVRPLAELPDVHRAAEAGLIRGKTILVP